MRPFDLSSVRSASVAEVAECLTLLPVIYTRFFFREKFFELSLKILKKIC